MKIRKATITRPSIERDDLNQLAMQFELVSKEGEDWRWNIELRLRNPNDVSKIERFMAYSDVNRMEEVEGMDLDVVFDERNWLVAYGFANQNRFICYQRQDIIDISAEALEMMLKE